MNHKLIKPLVILASLSLAAVIVGCSDNDNDTPTPTPDPAPRFDSVTASDVDGGGEILIDSEAGLTWINDITLDTRGDGCVSPANTGPIEPSASNSFCVNQQFAGFTDWRAPTAAELSALLVNSQAEETTLKYLNAACPINGASDGFVRTENANPAIAASAFTTAATGDILADANGPIQTIAGLNGVPSGVRCVRDGTERVAAVKQFRAFVASEANGGGEILIDNTNGKSWINGETLDPRGDGCVSPAAVGPIEPAQSQSRCANQNYAGFTNWRAPTATELSTLLTESQAEGAVLKYLNPACPINGASDGFVRTENANAAVTASAFSMAVTGEILSDAAGPIQTIAGLNGVPSGVRCVRDGVEEEPVSTSARFSTRVATNTDGGGETLVDSTTNLEWINDAELDNNDAGCVSPAAAGPIETTAANSRCTDQTFAGHSDWRAPSAAELTELITAAGTDTVKLNYLIAGCPALVATDGIVRTENIGNPAVATNFPDAVAGDVLGALLADVNGVPAGVRCVRDI